MSEDIVPLSSAQPTLVELADAVRQLQRALTGLDSVEIPPPFDPSALQASINQLQTASLQHTAEITALTAQITALQAAMLTMQIAPGTVGVLRFTQGGLKFKIVYGNWSVSSGNSTQNWHEAFTGSVSFAFTNQKEAGGDNPINLFNWNNVSTQARNRNASTRQVSYIVGGTDV